jgi:hypothetical protein
MTSIIQMQYLWTVFNSIKELMKHKDKNHRITSANMRNRVNDNS